MFQGLCNKGGKSTEKGTQGQKKGRNTGTGGTNLRYLRGRIRPTENLVDRLEALLAENERLKTQNWEEHCQDLHEYNCPSVTELRKKTQELGNAGNLLGHANATLREQIPEWVSVDERLPRYNRDVLCYRPEMAMKVVVCSYDGYYGEDDNEWYEEWSNFGYDADRNCLITHWMPIPEFREEDRNET